MTTMWFFFIATAAYLMANLFLASLALFCTVITTNLYQHNGSTRPPRWLTILAYDYIARLICLRRVVPEQKGSNDEMSVFGKQLANDMERQSAHADEAGVNASTGSTSNDVNVPTDTNPGISNLVAALMRSIVVKQEEEEAERRIKSEWNSIGVIFDRLFLIVFVIAPTVLTIGMIVIYPLFARLMIEDVHIH